MSDKVSVDLVELRYGGHQLGSWHVETSHTFDRGLRRVAEATESGWVGASARALAEKLDTLQASAQTVTARLGANASGFVTAADSFDAHDTEAGAWLNARNATPTSPDDGDERRLLNL
ncbi:hypothetical protein GDN83_21715 [Gordonia jinghuaiqii]|uniref:WXG100 family type VII secretion target n=1 Tax=Gordonia jinghuaiqii TaxID=2758710 RepID=A0A7D7R0D9_9ACTN|nr:hypothetical protein [Gordonia jinghuaiqii]MCR5980323.1 hypothetical protein [Gordonia jinghuaiqii]QMT01931.1 hypothetical protein H1R19_01675 [Gordonia jinghuaiqii]